MEIQTQWMCVYKYSTFAVHKFALRLFWKEPLGEPLDESPDGGLSVR